MRTMGQTCGGPDICGYDSRLLGLAQQCTVGWSHISVRLQGKRVIVSRRLTHRSMCSIEGIV